MVSIKSIEEKKKEEVEHAKETLHQGQRPGVDLICVIDVSGSMSGEKIELVKKSMSYLLEILNESDRLCIVTF
jgi:Mg-chelatase subunit ChlD